MAALEHNPESPELLTALGLRLMRSGDSQRAFDFLGTSLLHDPRAAKTILAAASIIQVRALWVRWSREQWVHASPARSALCFNSALLHATGLAALLSQCTLFTKSLPALEVTTFFWNHCAT